MCDLSERGIVEPDDYEGVRSELSVALLAFVDPESGEKPIAATYYRGSLYEGPYMRLAPDLLVKANDLWGMSSNSQSNGLSSSTPWPTSVNGAQASLWLTAPKLLRVSSEAENLRDIAPTVLAFFGLRAPSSAGSNGRGAAADNDHLRDLGYIE